jgi:hypothetical protein
LRRSLAAPNGQPSPAPDSEKAGAWPAFAQKRRFSIERQSMR